MSVISSLPERTTTSPTWLMPTIALLVTIVFASLTGLLAWGQGARDELTRAAIVSTREEGRSAIASLRAELLAAQSLGRTERENIGRQTTARDLEHDRAIREQGAQLQALSTSNAVTTGLLGELRNMVDDIRTTLRAWPLPERPMPRGGVR